LQLQSSKFIFKGKTTNDLERTTHAMSHLLFYFTSAIDSGLNESPKKQEMYARMETLLEALEHGNIEWLRSIVSKYSKEN
jgi:hypothetical protein